jgi:hypothetical protein
MSLLAQRAINYVISCSVYGSDFLVQSTINTKSTAREMRFAHEEAIAWLKNWAFVKFVPLYQLLLKPRDAANA